MALLRNEGSDRRCGRDNHLRYGPAGYAAGKFSGL